MRTLQQQADGMYAEDIRRGTLIDGRRVTAMTRGTLNGRAIVTVRFDEITRKGRKRLSAPVTYTIGHRVPGTRVRRTDGMPAGPVGAGRGSKSTSRGRGRDESGADYQTRLIDGLVYA